MIGCYLTELESKLGERGLGWERHFLANAPRRELFGLFLIAWVLLLAGDLAVASTYCIKAPPGPVASPS